MSKKTRWITTTGILLAVLIVLQALTKAGGQILTGSCVNLVLAIAALAGGLGCGLTIALLSPFFAYLLQIGPALFALTPCIALGNAVYVLLLALLISHKRPANLVTRFGFVVISAIAKFVTLYLAVVKFLLPTLGLPDEKLAVMSAMFSWPQLVTALIGGCVAVTIVPVLWKALKRSAPETQEPEQ